MGPRVANKKPFNVEDSLHPDERPWWRLSRQALDRTADMIDMLYRLKPDAANAFLKKYSLDAPGVMHAMCWPKHGQGEYGSKLAAFRERMAREALNEVLREQEEEKKKAQANLDETGLDAAMKGLSVAEEGAMEEVTESTQRAGQRMDATSGGTFDAALTGAPEPGTDDTDMSD